MAEAQGSLSSGVPFSSTAPQLAIPPNRPREFSDPAVLLYPQISGIAARLKSSSVIEGTSDVGVTEVCCPTGANGNGEHASTPKSARSIFIQFLQDFLCINFQGFQSGFGKHPDLILFEGPRCTTLAIPTSVMLKPREEALQFIQEKVETCEARFKSRLA
jgi:hypothetical protein